MDEPAEEISPFDVGHTVGRFHRSETLGYLKPQSSMRASPVVMLHIDPKDAIEMPGAEDQQPVQALCANRLDPALGVYRVAFPDSWWWNLSYEHAELGQIDACRFFSLDEFDITTASRGQPVPDGIAISITYHDGACLGFFNAQLSQEVLVGDFASAVGITPANIAVLKNGRARAIRLSTLESICRVLDCQPGDILRWTADPPAYRRAAAPLP